jgi:hypothetical protein
MIHESLSPGHHFVHFPKPRVNITTQPFLEPPSPPTLSLGHLCFSQIPSAGAVGRLDTDGVKLYCGDMAKRCADSAMQVIRLRPKIWTTKCLCTQQAMVGSGRVRTLEALDPRLSTTF